MSIATYCVFIYDRLKLIHLIETTFDRKRISANPSPNSNPNPKLNSNP